MSTIHLAIVIFLSYFILECGALNCHVRTGPGKESRWMNIYRDCVKKQERENVTEVNQKVTWLPVQEIILKTNNDNRKINESRKSDQVTANDKINRDKMSDTTTENEYDEEDTTDDDEVEDSTEGETDRSYTSQGEDYIDDLPQFEHYPSLPAHLQRIRRGKLKEMNSGQRSQYNPNAKRNSDEVDSEHGDDKNFLPKDKPKLARDNACALHCFAEALQMTDASGFPNKFFVRQAITKDVEDQELKDFLKESSDECFQILRGNKVDKCEYSRNLLICLSDKGKANCDDWKNDMHEIDLIGIKHFKDIYRYYVLNGLWT